MPFASQARLLVWRPDEEEPPADKIDLAVLPYMVGADYLAHLVGTPVRVIQSQMLGFERVAEFLPPSMVYCNAVGVHEESTAELALALTLASQRGLHVFRDTQRERRWARHRTPGLMGSRVLVIGAGGVGMQIAHRLEGFNADVRVMARTARDTGIGQVRSMDQLWDELPEADVVILAVPLSHETQGMVDEKFLQAMKDDALLVNVARGPVIDTDALTREVSSGRIRAALDVVNPEPLPAEHPLWACEGALISPHVGGETRSMSAAVDRVILGQIDRLAAGEPPAHIVLTG